MLLSVTVVAVSQVAGALPHSVAFAAGSPLGNPSEPPAQLQGTEEPIVRPVEQTQSSQNQALNPRRYLLAFGGALATGPAGLTGGFGTVAEGYVRASVLPPLGLQIGVSYLDLSVSNTDNYAPVHAQALDLNASWHPLTNSSFDPFLQLGELRLFNVSGPAWLSPSPWNTEGQIGVNYVVPYFAIGLQVRRAFTHYSWLMVGFQLEGRI